MKRRRPTGTAAALAICLVVSGCGWGAQPAPQSERTGPTAERSKAGRTSEQKEKRRVFAIPPPDILKKLKVDQLDQRMLEGEVEIAEELFPANRYGDLDCGGVLVGKRVYLTAAHCVENDLQINVAGFDATCECDEDFPPPTHVGIRPHDLAACVFTVDVISVGETVETVDTVAANVALGHKIMLTGYGGSSLHRIGTHLKGLTKVSKITPEGFLITDGGAWVRKNYGGDSGGADYHWETPQNRRVIAVNAMEGSGPKESVLWPLAPSASWLSRWSARNNAPICGLDGFSAQECHP